MPHIADPTWHDNTSSTSTSSSALSTSPTSPTSIHAPGSAASKTGLGSYLSLTEDAHAVGKCPCVTHDSTLLGQFRRRQSQQSGLAKYAMQSSGHRQEMMRRRESDEFTEGDEDTQVDELRSHLDRMLPGSNHENGVNGKHTRAAPEFKQQPGLGDFKLLPSQPPDKQQHSSLAAALHGHIPDVTGRSLSATMALNDTPATTAPNSPHLSGNHSSTSSEGAGTLSLGAAMRTTSGSSTPRVRPTTLDIPGLTKSKVSPDGRIAARDVGAKLVIVMVGLPARGKSYITKKLARYLNWLQHDCRIFNVGERRRVVAGGPQSVEKTSSRTREDRGLTLTGTSPPNVIDHLSLPESVEQSKPATVAQIMLNGETQIEPPETPAQEKDQSAEFTNHERQSEHDLQRPDFGEPTSPTMSRRDVPQDSMEQNAAFFDPENAKASQIREQVAIETLDELLNFILYEGGSVGILDATNSTMERRKLVMNHIRERAGPELNVLFLESRCVDTELLEGNMRLKLNGPDYKDMDPVQALEDFKKRVEAYEKAYVPLGDYEEQHNMPYIQMIDVGRKLISHQIKGFLMAQANYYLLNFNLKPRQIWITRHGLSMDNLSGKIGGDSELAPEGHLYAKALTRFMESKRREWDERQLHQRRNSHFPPQPGDVTPPNPYYQPQSPVHSRSSSRPSTPRSASDVEAGVGLNFCVWTSMLKRSVQTAGYFNDEEYELKQMRMLDELNAGVMEGLTYSCISTQYPEEYASRRKDKLHYRYPGPGGEGYLDIINRLRPVIVELERMEDHVLLVGHRSVARVLLAYFRGLKREEVAELDVPIGMLYCLEPKPYGVDFKAYRWEKESEWFYEVPDFKLTRAKDDMQ